MPFRYAYLTRGGDKIHTVARHNKAIQTFPTEQQARDEADRLNRQENALKTPEEKANWARYWENAPDRRPGPGSNVIISQTAGRRIMPGSPTPWGEAQQADHLGAGVHLVTCAGHGGLYLPDPVWDLLPPAVRQSMHLQGRGQYPKNWAEEDCDLPVVMPFILYLLDPARRPTGIRRKGHRPGLLAPPRRIRLPGLHGEIRGGVERYPGTIHARPRGLAPDKAAPSPAALRRRLQ